MFLHSVASAPQAIPQAITPARTLAIRSPFHATVSICSKLMMTTFRHRAFGALGNDGSKRTNSRLQAWLDDLAAMPEPAARPA
jgi:hypothetical protein